MKLFKKKHTTFLQIVIAILVVSMLFVNTVNASANFTSVASHPVTGANMGDGTRFYCVNIDYDGDGDQDFLARNGAGTYLFYKNNGSGSFTETIPNVVFPVVNGDDYFVVDINNDGDEDILVANGTGLSFYENDGTGIFELKPGDPLTSAGAYVTDGVVFLCVNIDYDGDGDQDFLASNSAQNAYMFYKNNGSGSFTEVTPNVAFPMSNREQFLIVDIDNDGDEDILVTDGSLYFYENDGTGDFTKKTSNPVTSAGATMSGGTNLFCTSIDYDIDGDQDFIAYNGTDAFLFYENNGSGSFSEVIPNVVFPLANGENYLVVDIDNDGDEDILVSYNSGVSFYRQDGISSVVDTPPTILTNAKLTLDEGATGSVQSLLAATDAEDADSTLTYTVTNLPDNGVLKNNGSAVVLNGTFNQEDINNNFITYTHDDSDTTSDSFGFKVIDSSGNEVGEQTFSITVNAVDDEAPTATITSVESDPTNSSPFSVTITFNEDVSGFTQGDITVGNGSPSNFVNTVANRVWTADITPSGDGAVTVDVNSGVCTDAAGNGNDTATQFSLDYDGTSPTVAITSGESDPTNSSPFTVTVTFNEAVSGFVIGDITVGNGSASNFTNTTPSRVWTADITPSGDGAVTVDVNSGVCTDAAGNGNDAATQFSLDYDGSASIAVITTTECDPTNSSTIPITIAFNEDVSGFVLGDITVGNGNASNFTNTVANRVWTTDIMPVADGAVTVDINAGVCVDAAGNGNDAAAEFSVDYDGTAPTVAITSGESDPTNSSPFTVTVTFNEAVSGFVIGDITVGNGSASNFTNTTPSRVWTADITPSGDGAVTVDINADVCTDAAGNGNDAATQFSLDYDGTSPTVAITSGESDPTNSSPFTVTVTFNEAVSGFVIGDITVGNGSASNFTNTTPSRVWTADITPSGDGAVTVDVNSGVCTDAVGNGNDTATQFSLDYDGTAPTVPVNTGLIVNEGATETVTTTELSATDTIADDASLIYTVTDLPDNGVLQNNGAVLAINGTFTQQDIIDGKIQYVHNGSETTSDSFTFKVADNVGNELTGQTFSTTVTPVNDDPTITLLPTDISVVEDTPSNVDLSAVTISDADSDAGCITLNITASAGTLSATSGSGVTVSGSGSSTLTLSGTVANIDTYLNTASNIQYTGVANSYGNDAAILTLTANDGGNTGMGGGTNVNLGTVNIDIMAVNDNPTMLGLPTDIMVTEDTASDVNLTSAVFSDDSGANSITLTITASAGTLSATSGSGVAVSGSGTSTLTLSGTVANIDIYLNTASNIQYTGVANAYGNNAAILTLTANDGGNTGVGGGADVAYGTVNVDIAAVNDTPSVTTNAGLSLNEGASATITTEKLSATDVETADGLLTYIVTAGLTNGQLENTDNPGVSITSFTQQNLIDGKIQYVHDGSNTTSDSFTFKVSDSDGGARTGQTFNISVNAIDDDAPSMVNKLGIILDEGAVKTITITELSAIDTEADDAALVYTVTGLPNNGEIRNDGSALLLNGTFTQQDIIDGKIQYVHDGSSTTLDSFDFKVADINANELSGQTFSITINLAPLPTITPSPTQTPGENTRTINGTLLDEDGNPKVGYVVELHSTPITTITDSQGRYRFDNVDYTAHTLFVKTPEGEQIASFGLEFEQGDEFSKSMTSEGADITYTENTVSVDITIALGGDEDDAVITELSGVDNPATGRTLSLLIWVLMASLAAGLIGWAVYKRVRVRS